MPIVLSKEFSFAHSRLEKAGALVVSEKDALKQDIRPAKIGILNLMPAVAMEATENQWLRYISNSVLQVEPYFLKFDNDVRERPGSSREKILKNYIEFSRIKSHGLDALIVTGDNLELDKNSEEPKELPFAAIRYEEQLKEIIDWARENVFSSIYSCLASHFALNYLYGINRSVGDKKILGVFEHSIKKYSDHPLLKNIDDSMKAPHSRWGDANAKELIDSGVEVLATNDEVGWLLASDRNKCGGYDIYLQGHPEYDKYDLHSEFMRDWHAGQKMPRGYYADENPASLPKMTWANDARAIHSNWISMIYSQFSDPQD